MSLQQSLYRASSEEQLLNDGRGLVGRKNELRSFLQWLEQAKQGQPRAILLSGDEGIGKTAFLNTLQTVLQEDETTHVLTAACPTSSQPLEQTLSLQFQVQIYAQLQQLIQKMFAAQWKQIQERLDILNLSWQPSDLKTILYPLTLDILQDKKRATKKQAELKKAIYKTIPFFQKLKPSTLDAVKKLVEQLMDPWLWVALEQQNAENLPTLGSERSSVSLQQLMTCLQQVGQALSTHHQAGLFIIEDWDHLQNFPEMEREALKALLTVLLDELTEPKGGMKESQWMVVVSSRPQGESYTLAGAPYGLLKQKILLPPLSVEARNLLFQRLKRQASELEIEETVKNQLLTLSEGTPFWLEQGWNYLKTFATSSQVPVLTEAIYGDFDLRHPQDFLELNFSKLKLSFIQQEEGFYGILRFLLHKYPVQSFSVPQVLASLEQFQDSPGWNQPLAESMVIEVLRELLFNHFLVEVTPVSPEDDSHEPVSPTYQFGGRVLVSFLQQKLMPLQPDLNQQEKIAYLQKVIPLSLKAGELDRRKTQEMIALAEALGNQEFLVFLETLFYEHLADPTPAIRRTALGLIALFPGERQVQALLVALNDEDWTIRQLAVEELQVILENYPGLEDFILPGLIQAMTDEVLAVQEKAYTALAPYAQLDELLFALFVEGTQDDAASIRQICFQGIAGAGGELPQALQACLVGLEDPSPSVRTLAIQGLGFYLQEPEVLARLLALLHQETDPNIRVSLIQTLIHVSDKDVFETLAALLENPAEVEDVQLAVARLIGHNQGGEVESLLCRVLAAYSHYPSTVLWACLRTLGDVGKQESTVTLLEETASGLTNEIVRSTLTHTLEKIKTRLSQRVAV